MHKLALIYGSIAGVITGAMFFLFHPTDGQVDFEGGEIGGYITMFVAFFAIVIAVQQYRKNHTEGNISFGKAFSLGLYVSLIASMFYVASWELYTSVYDMSFAESYITHLESQLAAEGVGQPQIDQQIAEDKKMMDLYASNTAFRMGITFIEIFPIGFIVSLFNALSFAFLLKKNAV